MKITNLKIEITILMAISNLPNKKVCNRKKLETYQMKVNFNLLKIISWGIN